MKRIFALAALCLSLGSAALAQTVTPALLSYQGKSITIREQKGTRRVADVSERFDEKATLLNIKRLNTLSFITVTDPEAKKALDVAGITEENLMTLLELKLRQNKIHVMDAQDNEKTKVDFYLDGMPSIAITILTIRFASTPYIIYYLTVECKQECIVRRLQKSFQVVTWSRDTLGIIPFDKVRELKDKASDYIDTFINELLKVQMTSKQKK